jgi:hypothetical protein
MWLFFIAGTLRPIFVAVTAKQDRFRQFSADPLYADTGGAPSKVWIC